ncbi:MAG: cell division protease FtsH, partial [Frankiaceae bacterium]|nr:cell division protease FtsH [Frankiaceae bacterium]
MEHNDTTASGGLVANPLLASAGSGLIAKAGADVGRNRETLRRQRLWRVAKWIGAPAALLWWRILDGHGINFFQIPSVDPMTFYVGAMIVIVLLATVLPFLIFGRSPHVMYRPEQIDVTLDQVVGIDGVKDEVVRSLNLFLSHKTFASTMGGTPRRGLLFEGAPGTGKTYTAKAMAREAGVPFLFVSATSFQSMMYGATAMKIRKYFKAVRAAALAEGGAIAFIEEIDAIGGARNGLAMTAHPLSAQNDFAKSVQCCGGVTTLPSSFLAMPATSPAT